MPEQPPLQLVATLERLGLATAGQVASMGRRVRRLARDLPRFESVWVDSLLQARILTPFQAAEINAGRGDALLVGPYVLFERLPHPYYVACYRARHVESHEAVRLAIVDNAGQQGNAILRQLESLVGCVQRTGKILPSPIGKRVESERVGGKDCGESLSPRAGRPHPNPLPKGEGTITNPLTKGEGTVTCVGVDVDRIFAAAPWVAGRTAADWMVHHGRFPPEVVIEIARAMLVDLVALEASGMCHGDVGASSLVLSDRGDVVLLWPGLRSILRPEEGYANADLPPEAYDSLAPERVSAGTPPNISSDIYACGCLWWQLLCGRPPLVGGSSLAKLRAAQAAEVCDVRRYATDVPPSLAGAISACLQREPSRRPESMARLAATLGLPTRSGKEALADCLARAGRPTVHWTTTIRTIRKSNRTPLWTAGAVCCLAAAVALLWPFWQRQPATSEVATMAAGQGSGDGRQPEQGRQALTLTLSQRERGPVNISQRERGQTEDIQKESGPAEETRYRDVVAASYRQVDTKPEDLVLPAGKPMTASSLDLHAGQCVRGPSGQRAAVLVPCGGLIVDKENIRFENVDFVWRSAAVQNGGKVPEPALIQLLASRAEFRGCSFQCDEKAFVPVSAVRWVHPTQGEASETALPSGRLRFANCLLYRVSIGVDCRTAGALAIDFGNTLHLDAGPLVRLDHCPAADEPVSIVLTQVTLRGGGPLLECLAPQVEQQPGEIAVLATACAFVPEPGTPLVRLSGAKAPVRLLTALRWTGQGSLVAPRVPIVAWRGDDGRQQAVDESSLSVAGLVRSSVTFAGAASSDPAASRLIRWQAPLQSADAPGIDPAPLPLANVEK